MNGLDFDWSLCEFVEFAECHALEFENVSLRHFRLNIDEKAARQYLVENEPAGNLLRLRKIGWKMLTPVDFCYFGSEPEPEPPFLSLFMDSINRQETRGRALSGYSYLSVIAGDLDDSDDDAVGIDSELNTFCCTLSSLVFDGLDYGKELVDLMWRRKNGVFDEDHESPILSVDERTFARHCDLVEILVLDLFCRWH